MSNPDLLLRKSRIDAMINYIISRGYTPEVMINTFHPNVNIEMSHANPHGGISFNIAAHRIRNYTFSEEGMGFNYTRGGIGFYAFAPVDSIIMVYARENTSVKELYDYMHIEHKVVPKVELRLVTANDIQGDAPIGDPSFKLHVVQK